MSTEVETRIDAPNTQSPQILDLTGLPAPVVEGLRTIVASLRVQHPTTPTRPVEETAEEWIARLDAWIASNGVRVGGVRDDRESIYEGRGE